MNRPRSAPRLLRKNPLSVLERSNNEQPKFLTKGHLTRSKCYLLERAGLLEITPASLSLGVLHKGQTKKTSLVIRNVGQTTERISISSCNDPAIKITFTSGSVTRIAPGMSINVEVEVTPEASIDRDIFIHGELEVYKVPLRVIFNDSPPEIQQDVPLERVEHPILDVVPRANGTFFDTVTGCLRFEDPVEFKMNPCLNLEEWINAQEKITYPSLPSGSFRIHADVREHNDDKTYTKNPKQEDFPSLNPAILSILNK